MLPCRFPEHEGADTAPCHKAVLRLESTLTHKALQHSATSYGTLQQRPYPHVPEAWWQILL